MGRDGKPTRDKILAESRALVLEHGFAGTSIDQILERTGITKGAFFYHFKSKADLADSLLNDFYEADLGELNHALSETQVYADDPVQRLLQFVQFFIEAMDELESPYPGCLYASYGHEPKQFNQEIKDKICSALLSWRHAFEDMLEKAITTNSISKDIDRESLADMFTVILEGAFVVSRALNDAKLTSKQLKHYKNYLELLFE